METQAIQVNENVEVGVITHEGKEFSAYGFVRTSDRLTAYLGENGQLTKWDGTPVGTYRITRTWRTPRSYVSSTLSQVYATLTDGTKWTGRSAGKGMSCNMRLRK
jgi:hypothetical protein